MMRMLQVILKEGLVLLNNINKKEQWLGTLVEQMAVVGLRIEVSRNESRRTKGMSTKT